MRVLIRILQDGEIGFSDIGGKMTEPKHRSFYLEEASVRRAYAAELERALETLAGVPVHEGGTLLGPVHRAWLDAKAALGASDEGLLDSTELCERLAVRTYEEALGVEGLPGELQAIIERQAAHVRLAVELVVRFREEAGG